MPAPLPAAEPGSITRLVNLLRAGEAAPDDPRLPGLYADLRRLAAAALRRRGDGWRLRTNDLVHMAYLRLCHGRGKPWDNRREFFGAASRAMQRILADLAAAPGARPMIDVEGLDLEARPGAPNGCARSRELDAADVSGALAELEAFDAQLADLVRLRVFGGLTLAQIAEYWEIPPRTLDRQWALARNWLAARMSR